MLQYVRLSFCLSLPCLCTQGKNCAFQAYAYHRTPVGHCTLIVKPTGQRGLMTTISGQNGLDLEKYTSSISRYRRHKELWLLLNVNGKSQAACHLPQSSMSSNHRNGPNLTFTSQARLSLVNCHQRDWYISCRLFIVRLRSIRTVLLSTFCPSVCQMRGL